MFSLSQPILILIGAFVGIFAGFADIPFINTAAHVVSDMFMRFLKLLSLPVITFALLSTISGLGNWDDLQRIGFRIVRYTLLTTILAASIAALLFNTFNPKIISMTNLCVISPEHANCSYATHLLNIVPDNIIQPFVEGNVIGVLFIALFFGIGLLALPLEKRVPIHNLFSGIFEAVMKLISWLVLLMPIAVLVFVTEFVREIRNGLEISQIFIYIAIVIGANLIQAFIVLPILLKIKGIPVWKSFKGMIDALSLAFFSKSSTAAMPLAIKCSENLGVSSKIARFSFPLCTTINMNACAGFIYITVLFVSTSHGLVFTPFEKTMYILVATIAAIGNAGVPMGCFFLASSLLTTMGVPLTLMGVILPVYALIDMVETAINIWSDACVTFIVEQELKEK